MKNELLEYLEELEENERESLDETVKMGLGNSCGAGMNIGAIETIQKVKEWLDDNNDHTELLEIAAAAKELFGEMITINDGGHLPPSTTSVMIQVSKDDWIVRALQAYENKAFTLTD